MKVYKVKGLVSRVWLRPPKQGADIKFHKSFNRRVQLLRILQIFRLISKFWQNYAIIRKWWNSFSMYWRKSKILENWETKRSIGTWQRCDNLWGKAMKNDNSRYIFMNYPNFYFSYLFKHGVSPFIISLNIQ